VLHVAGRRRSLYDLTPLKGKIRRDFDASKVSKNGYKFGVGVVSAKTGEFRIVKHSHQKIEDYIYASCAQAFAFPPIKIDDEWWIDGGPRCAVPLDAALDGGAKNVFMVLTEAEKMAEDNSDFVNGFEVGLRTIQILAHEVYINDVSSALRNAQDAGVNVVMVGPQTPLIADPLDFGKEQARRLIERGYEDAVQQLSEGE